MSEQEVRKWIMTLKQLGYVIITPEEMEKMKADYANNEDIFLGDYIGEVLGI